MPGQKFNTLDHYEGFIQTKISGWSPEQRIALAAGMAERWLPAYEQFSKSENWGDPTVLRQCLNSIWMEVSNKAFPAIKWSSMRTQVQSITPHMDDFDAYEALCACVMAEYAIDCCTEKNNNTAALMAVLSGLEAIQPELLELDHVPAHVWKSAGIRNEINKQLRLIDFIESLSKKKVEYQVIQSFVTDPQMAGEILPREKQDGGPVGRTNQEIFVQYWQIIQADLKHASNNWGLGSNPEMAAMFYLSAWSSRYSRRKQMLSGEYGQLGDQPAVKSLIAKNIAKDLAETNTPMWDGDARWLIELFYNNPLNGMDAKSPDSPHAYGPSLRRLWVEAKRTGLSDQETWDAIKSWAHFQPGESSGKSKGKKIMAFSPSPEVKAYLARPMHWSATGNMEIPWKAASDGTSLEVRLNDFPDEIMYTLMVNGEEVGKFHDWPKLWERDH